MLLIFAKLCYIFQSSSKLLTSLKIIFHVHQHILGLQEFSLTEVSLTSITWTLTSFLEFIAAVTSCQEALLFHNFFNSIQLPIIMPTPLYSDNQSVINLTTTRNVNECSKHNKSGYILILTSTDQWPADEFTNPLSPVKFPAFLGILGPM